MKKVTQKPYNPWAMCARCKDVHRDSERVMKKCSLCNGVWWSHCPKCGSSTKTPMASIPRQRDIFEVAA